MVGKDPHRPQGKTKDAESMGAVAYTKEAPYTAPSAAEIEEEDRWQQRMRGGASRHPAEEEVGGSRPGVESRVKDAIDKRELKKR